MTQTTKNHHPSMLAFSRSVDPSAFLMFSKQQDGSLVPIEVVNETTRCTFVNNLAPAQRDKANNINIQRGDVAYLSSESDTLVIRGTLKFSDNTSRPAGINESKKKDTETSFTEAFADFRAQYVAMDGFSFIAEKMLMNLLCGYILWRNADSATAVRVTVRTPDQELTIDRQQIAPAQQLELDGIQDPALCKTAETLRDKIAAAFSGKTGPLVLEVKAEAVLGQGQVVYPSQEFYETSGNNKEKVLAKRKTMESDNHAYIHPQKIGNALRRWDLGYAKDAAIPLPIEVYGMDMARQQAFRTTKNSFYDYITKLESFAGKEDFETHYIMGCFIRGGVFGKASEKAAS